MKIAFDITPLSSEHRFRGIGSYTQNLVKTLKQYDERNSYIFFTRGEKLPKNIDLVHYPYFDPFFLTLSLQKIAKTVVTIHDLIPLVFPDKFPMGFRGRIKWGIQKVSLKGVKAIITDSENSKKDIIRLTGFPADKIYVIYLAPNPEFRQIKDSLLGGVKEKYNLPEKFILYVGDVTWNKNIPGLILAIKKINIPLVIVGKQATDTDFDHKHPENQDLVLLEKEVEKDRRIIRLGFIPKDDLVAIYNLATVYCQPSFYEGFGLPILEAMACGCPVITTKEGSLPEVGGEACFYVDAYDQNKIANGINEVLRDKKLRDQLSQNGILQAKKFSWEKTAKKTIEVYEKTN